MDMSTPPSSAGGRRPRGALERGSLAPPAAAEGPLTPAQVLASLHDDLAYTTVMTTLSRLHEKGVLQREQAGRAYAYRIATDQDAARAATLAHKMRRLLDAGEDRAGVLAHFVADLAPEDERLLTSLL